MTGRSSGSALPLFYGREKHALFPDASFTRRKSDRPRRNVTAFGSVLFLLSSRPSSDRDRDRCPGQTVPRVISGASHVLSSTTTSAYRESGRRMLSSPTLATTIILLFLS